MSGSARRRLKSEISRGNNFDDADDGTAARTRPLSYDEIMLKRKSKKELDVVRPRDEVGEVRSSRHERTNPGHHSRDTGLDAKKNSRDYVREDTSRKKENKLSRVEDTHGKSKNKENHDMEGRSKHKHEKDVRVSSDMLKNDSRGHGRSRPDEHSRDDSRYDNEKRHHRDSVQQDRHMERSRGAPEKENKRKDRSGEDEKHRVRDSVKKHDSGNRRDSEISERKEKLDLSRSHHDERRSKRRRSRSQDHVKDTGRRSRSLSPKTHKNVSSHGPDHGQLSLHSQRDKSGRHVDIDRNNKMPSNGSTSHHRRHGVSSSGLGGYSPRKRKTEAAVKTPSPIRSPERKSNAGWDLPPSGSDTKPSASVSSAPQLLSQAKSSTMSELAAGISFSSTMEKPLSAILPSNLSAFNVTSIDSIQLTQATRPMRRLYIDNIPGSASEKDIIECFNDFLVSAGANRILGRRPCISCMIHKEKGQALVEFLTPEDASAALSFDGRYLFGSIVKIRRPKDFVEVASMPAYSNQNRFYNTITRQSGPSEKTKHGDDAVSDIVKDSPHKIFIGGIAEGLSSDMIMAIVGAFGPLKAYHLEINTEVNERCAYIEYADQSVTLKACAGLNGMKLGGRILTVAQAVPNTSPMGNSEKVPFYGIPEHVKPLLEMPTQVLKLSNVLDQHAMNLLSETDLEEIVEDVRLECSRFGSVVSINVVRTNVSESKELSGDLKPLEGRVLQEHPAIGEVMGGAVEHGDGEVELDHPSNVEKYEAGDNVEEGEKHGLDHETATNITVGDAERSTIEDVPEADRNIPHGHVDEATANQPQELDNSTIEDVGKSDGSDVNQQEVPINDSGVESGLHPDEYMGVDKSGDKTPNNAEDVDKTSDKLQDVNTIANYPSVTNQETTENGEKDENACDIHDVFEVGCVLVEFKRAEACCMAAHCLHGRAFDDRVVTVQYVPLEAYRSRFPK